MVFQAVPRTVSSVPDKCCVPAVFRFINRITDAIAMVLTPMIPRSTRCCGFWATFATTFVVIEVVVWTTVNSLHADALFGIDVPDRVFSALFGNFAANAVISVSLRPDFGSCQSYKSTAVDIESVSTWRINFVNPAG